MNTVPDDIKRCIRTSKYKYIRNFNEGPLFSIAKGMELSPTGLMMETEDIPPRPETELYDIENDKYEKNNLSGQEEFSIIENELSKKLKNIMTETNDPVLQGPIPRPPVEKEKLERYAALCERDLMEEKNS
jgi:hypothetical protein